MSSTMSVWRGTARAQARPALAENLSADVAIVGGGITGVTLALLLAEAGRSVVLLEAREIGLGDTGHSTGNLYQTVTGGLQTVQRKWGTDVARAVARSRGETIDFIEQQAAHIAGSGFRRCPAYFYAGSPDARRTVSDEHDAALAAGVPARLEFELPEGPPAPQGQVLVMEGQAQFHPLAYVQGLAERAIGRGARIFEQSPVLEIDASTRVLRTAAGRVSAREIVLATHSPVGMHLVHAGLLARREYGIAFRAADWAPGFPSGIFWAQGFERLSVRGLDTAEGSFVVCIGQQHETGQGDPPDAMEKLEQIARRRVRAGEPVYRWSAQHFHSPDELPYIGPDARGLHIATGFSTDGLTYGTLAARIIADRIAGRENRWSELYKASRIAPLKAAAGTIKETIVTTKALVQDYVIPPDAPKIETLQPGQGAIVDAEGDRLAAYRDPDGTLHVVSPVCTHMHCMVRWNALETSWDCPCHGSRFAPDGRVLEGPALQPLKRMEVPGKGKAG